MLTLQDRLTMSIDRKMDPVDKQLIEECNDLADEIDRAYNDDDDVDLKDPGETARMLRHVGKRVNLLYKLQTTTLARLMGAHLTAEMAAIADDLQPAPKMVLPEVSPELLDKLNEIFSADEDDEVRFNITDKGYPHQNDVRLFKQNEVEPMAAAALLFSKDFPSVLRGGILRYIQDWIRLRPGKPEIVVHISDPNEGQETAGPPEAETVDTSEKV